MAQNLDEKRKQLYNIIKKGNPDYERAKFDLNFSTQKTFESFVQLILKNKKEKPKTHWDLILVKDLAGFYRTFACDMPWAKDLSYCGDGNGDGNIDDYVGTYTTTFPKIKKVEIYKRKDEKDEDSLYLSSIFLKNIPQLEDYTVAKLTPKADSVNVFTISSEGVELPDATISFTNNEFTFKYKVLLNQFLTITGKKEQVVTNEPTDKKDDKKKTDSVTSTTTQDNKKPNIPIVKSKPLYFNKQKKITIPTKPCDDFPFTLGCVNSKIGDLNAALFSGDRNNDTYNKQLENFLDNRGYFSNSKNELTKDTWDDLINRNVIKESIKKVLKEYINKKK